MYQLTPPFNRTSLESKRANQSLKHFHNPFNRTSLESKQRDLKGFRQSYF